MGEAFDRSGNMLGTATGPTKADVLKTLESRYGTEAADVRIRQMAGAQTNQAEPAYDPIPGTQEQHLGLQGYGSQELGLNNIEDAMKYQPWHPGQQIAGEIVRDALLAAAKAILRNVPRSPRRTLALQHLISARMDANCAISFGGRF